MLVMPTQRSRRLSARTAWCRAQGRAVLGLVGINAVVRAGAPKPDLSTPDKVKQAIARQPRAMVHAPPGATPSGTQMDKVIEATGHHRCDERQDHSPARARRRRATDRERRGRDRHFTRRARSSTPTACASPGRCRRRLQLTTIYGAAVTRRAAPRRKPAAAFIALHDAIRRIARHWTHAGFDPTVI